ncbi:MAG TPA: outer membrane beta-barrel protein, partial [Rhizomicrobium sp.]
MNFKTSFAIAALALACFSSSADARGNGNNWLFYVGGDYQYTKPSWEAPFDKVLANSLDNGIDIHVGARWNGYFAAELGYTQSTGDRDIYGPPPAAGVKGPLVAKTDVTISGPTLD